MKAIPIIACAMLLGFGIITASTAGTPNGGSKEIVIKQQWTGDYPVSQLDRLPENRSLGIGYMDGATGFAAVWQAFKPDERVPEVDFARHFAVFVHNVDFYNRLSIGRVKLIDGVLEVVAMETLSSLPIEDKVAMALVIVSREGVRFVQAGDKRIPVLNKSHTAITPAEDYRQACYLVEGRELCLTDGHSALEAAPESATTIETSLFGQPARGDLDGDGVEDTALLLLHQPGGSGTFYYLAAALRRKGYVQGINAVLLGDRIDPPTIDIQNGVVIAYYLDRRSDESMTTPPSIGKSKYLVVKDEKLVAMEPLNDDEQVLAGWVTIGHEVRSLEPCPDKAPLWLRGDPAVLERIVTEHRGILPNRKRYAPLFMVLAGRYAEQPRDGFGAQYDGAFVASQLIQVWPKGNCKSHLIVVDTPTPGDIVSSPLQVRGRARGTWFFEGDFPMILKDGRGKTVAEGFCKAQGEWMTTEFVPFRGTLPFAKTQTPVQGTLVLKKDNPTALPQHDARLEIPVFFE